MVPDTCGETRFIYRMTNAQGERLPVALAVVFLQPGDGAQCRTVAQQWMLAGNRVTVLADPGRPLDAAAIPSRPARVELNAQSAEDAQGRTCNELRVFVHERDDRFTPTVREGAPGWPVYTASSRVSLARRLTQSPWVESVVQGTLTKRPPVSGKKGSSGSGWWFAPESRASYSALGRGMLHGKGRTADAAGEYSALGSATRALRSARALPSVRGQRTVRRTPRSTASVPIAERSAPQLNATAASRRRSCRHPGRSTAECAPPRRNHAARRKHGCRHIGRSTTFPR